MAKSGIYKIENSVNGNIYIGSSSDVGRRIKRHKYELKNNKHHSQYLQRAYNKYGAEKFKFTLIEYCAIDEMLDIEQKYLNELKPAYNVSKNTTAFMLGIKRPKSFGDNISRLKKGNKYFEGKTHTDGARKAISKGLMGNKNGLGNKHTEEVKELIRAKTLKQFENGMPLETRRKLGKPVVQLSLEFEYIKEHHTAKEAGDSLGIGHRHIGNVCKGKRNTSGGYRWMYVDDYDDIEIRQQLINEQLKREKEQTVNRKTRLQNKQGKEIIDIRSGIIYSSMVECAKELNIKIDEVRRRTKGNSRQCGEIIFEYVSD